MHRCFEYFKTSDLFANQSESAQTFVALAAGPMRGRARFRQRQHTGTWELGRLIDAR